MANEEVQLAQNFKKGTAVWLPCADNVWTGGIVVDDFVWSDGVIRVQLDDGNRKEVPVKNASALPYLRNPEFLIDTNDLTTLSYLHEPDVLHSLRYRFDLGNIYTYCGIVLVAINPYRECDLYGKNIFALYRDRNVRQLDPHIYAVAEEAFASMSRYNKSQSIIVSGESGAGKTVSAKYVMQYLAEACSFHQRRGTDQKIEKRTLASNPIMEALGNAKTVRNDNSSRFGKFIQLLFTEQFSMCGANMKTYLLEKTRVVNQGLGERNYHIFYQICAARNKDPMLKQFGLEAAEKFSYLSKGACVKVDDVDDADGFFQTKEAMKLLGIPDDRLTDIFLILSGLLHFGNVEFEQTNSQNCTLTGAADDAHLIASATLWGVQESGFRKWLRYRLLLAGGETIHQGLNAHQARAARDATAKFVYLRLFAWIVEKINECLRVDSKSENQKLLRFVGVLDIYGFEIFEMNSFEQLCINYANEMLQQQFNQHVFKLEQAEYIKEGIQWSFINFHDNQPCLDLIEGRLGILDLLDQECKMPSANDENWLNVMSNQPNCGKSPHFTLPKIRKKPGEFVVKHFASGVTYRVLGFVEKNMDNVNAEQLNVLKSSTNVLLAELLRDDASPVEGGKQGYKLTALNGPAVTSLATKKCLASQFRESLRDLKSVLDSTMPHYVRCIKPNDEKAAFQFDVARTVEQLRACGVLETIRISAAGYPSRWIYDEFRTRYRLMLSKQKHGDAFKNSRKTAEIVCATYLQTGKFELGKTKIFFRTGQVALLESLRSEKLKASAILIQKTYRGFIARKRYVKIRNSVRTIQAAGRAWLAFRYVKFIQMQRAAVFLQKNIRKHVARRRFVQITTAIRFIQKHWRGALVRRRLAKLRHNQRVTMIQKYCRGFLVRSKFQRQRKAAVVIQCWVRRWLARRLLKRLKVEARSVEHLENLNKGLENKIISLQQRLDKTAAEREHIRKEAAVVPHLKQTLDVTNLDLEQARKRVQELEIEIKGLREQMQTFEEDVVGSRKLAETEMIDLRTKNENITDELERVNEMLAAAERSLEAEQIESQRLREELEIISTTASSLQTVRKDDAVSVSSSDFPDHEEKKAQDAGAPVTLLLEMERRMDKAMREKERVVQKVYDASLTKDIEKSFTSAERTMFISLLERSRTEDLEVENHKLRQELGRFVTEVSSGKPDLNSLLEAQRMELDRRREESMMLRTLLSEQFETGSTKDKVNALQENEKLRVLAFEQKKLIRSLTEEMSSKDQRLIDMQMETDRLRVDNERQQKLLLEQLEADEDEEQTNFAERVNSSEIQRLLAEKMALKRQLDSKFRTIKKLKSAFEMKFATDENQNVSVKRAEGPVVRQSLGMIQAVDIDHFLRLIVRDFSPSSALHYAPGLPAYVLLMAIRYEDHVEREDQLSNLFARAYGAVDEITKDRFDFDTLSMWLANVWRLMQLCRQYSGEEEYNKLNTPHQNEFVLKHYDLTDYRVKLGELATRIYAKLVAEVCETMFPSSKIVTAVLEYEANVGFFTESSQQSKLNGYEKRQQVDSMKRFLEELNFVYERFTSFGFEYSLMVQIFGHLFRSIEVCSWNELMFRKSLCNFNKGVTIKHNVATLCNWLRDRKLNTIVRELDRLEQATNLLQMRKTEADIDSINEHGSLLNVGQIKKLMTHYNSMDGIEPNIPASFVQKLVARLNEYRKTSEKDVHAIFMTTTSTPVVEFPYVPSTLVLDTIDVPSFLDAYICRF